RLFAETVAAAATTMTASVNSSPPRVIRYRIRRRTVARNARRRLRMEERLLLLCHNREFMSSAERTEPRPHLRRELGLWALVFYGIIMIQPVAPMPLFGVVSQVALGHMVSTLAIA